MGSRSDGTRARGPGGSERITVEHGGRHRPFMRGIMVHSLMARGVSFDDAYRTANEVRDRVRGLDSIPRSEIAKLVREILGEDPFREDPEAPIAADIVVTGGATEIPFSKGVLSQSLLAAAIEPNDAFDVARDIERDLVRRQVRQVSRHELRRLAYEALISHKGPNTAERYLVWRKYQEPDRPVLILLGGTTGVGKTSLALEVAHRLGIGRVLSTDSIRQIMRVMLSRELVPSIHGSSYDAERLLDRIASDQDPVVAGFSAQTAAVSVGIRASIDRAIAENASMVMDGVSLVPGQIDLEDYAGLADVVFLVVASLDEDAFASRFESRAADSHRRAKHRYLENLGAILSIQEHVLTLADGYSVPIVDNASFDKSVLAIIRHVTETLKKRDTFDAAELL